MMDLRIGSLLLLRLAAAATATTTVTRTRTTTVTETTTVQAPRIFRFEPRPRMEEGGYKTCDLQRSECSIAKMPRDESTVVYPGGDTRCISEKTAFGFQVIPGDGDKLLVFFQGGGACWDAASTKRSMCVEDAYPSYMTGLLDRSNAKNPYVNHTVVQLLYCSGDAFAADAADHGWTTADGDRAVQSGQQNADATFAWLRGQVGALSDLVIGGDSAGSLAAQAWGNAIFDMFPAARKTALLDSYLGVFPDGCQGNVLSEVWPMCTGPLATSLAALGLDRACAAGNLTIQKVLAATATRHADAPFAFIQSKADAVQKGFFESIALSFKSWPFLLSDSKFYERANEILLGLDALPNVVHYAVDGDMHTFTEDGLVYEADGTGPKGGGGGRTLIDWIARIAVDRVATTECAGALEDEPKWSGSTYCPRALANKTFSPTGV